MDRHGHKQNDLDRLMREHGEFPDLTADEYDATTDPTHWLWNPLAALYRASEGEWRGLSQLLGKLRTRRSTLKAYKAATMIVKEPEPYAVPEIPSEAFRCCE